jgi:predicted nucleotidyltransferase
MRQRVDEIVGIWGFGSFFRSNNFNDVDILVIVECKNVELLNVTKIIRANFQTVARELRCSLDVTILTQREFEEQPLREMDQLVHLA